MKGLVAISALLIITMLVMPAHASIKSFKADKDLFTKDDKITFSGTVDNSDFGKQLSISVYDLHHTFVTLGGAFPDYDGNYQSLSLQSSKFTTKGTYNATVFFNDNTGNKMSILFDYSPDGTPVSPSAAQLMNKQPQTTQTSQQQTPPTQQPQSQQSPTQQPAQQPSTQQPAQQPSTQQPAQQPSTQQPAQQQEQQEPQCGSGTILKGDVCVVAEPQPTTTTNKIPGFPDPNKDPQYYVDRYKNEPDFKAWFDRNFPGQSIYDVVGAPAPTKTEVGCGTGTHLENGVCVLDEKKNSPLSGCLIATATYGTELAPQVQQLRELRENTLLTTNSGTTFLSAFNNVYYSFSPTVADWERQNPVFKELVKVTVTPMLSTLSLLNHVEINSEQEMLGYGIGIILLNIGMYFVAPALVIINLKKLFK
jgi:hypothetical protein